ncbi:MAG: hypothetical protein ACR2I8_05930 [Steroidobacteraceae bacterium]
MGIVALLLGFSRWLAHRPWAAAGNLGLALALFMVAHASWPAVMHMRTYDRLPRRSAVVAEAYCERTGPHEYRMTLTRLPEGRMQVFMLRGDQWRVDARSLVWQDRAAALGLPDGFRLEQLSARLLRAEDASPAAAAGSDAGPGNYALVDRDADDEDLWSQARTGRWWADQLVPTRVYGPWRPLANGALFHLWLSRTPVTGETRLDATAANEAARRAMR